MTAMHNQIMDLEADYRLGSAPLFQNAFPWPERIRLGRMIERAGNYFPAPEWRPATSAELALLLAETAAADRPAAEIWNERISLFSIPEHIRSRWWRTAGRPEGPAAGVEELARAISDFALFKNMPLPPRCTFDVVLSAPGQAAPPPEAADAPGVNPAVRLPVSEQEARAPQRLIAAVNLGDERSSVVFLNLHRARMARILSAGEPRPRREAACLAPRFWAAFPTYPLVRLFLDPGEGIWFPVEGMIHTGYTLDKQEIDVWLSIRETALRSCSTSAACEADTA